MNHHVDTANHDIDSLFAAARNSEPYLDNGCFSTRVLATVTRRSGLSFWKEALITLLFTLVGCTIAYIFFPSERLVELLPTRFVISPTSLLTVVGLISLACGSAYWAEKTNRI